MYGVHDVGEVDCVSARVHFEVITPEEHAHWVQRKLNM
jgi:hypothetical protein